MPINDFQSIMVKISRSPKMKALALKQADLIVAKERDKLLADFNNHVVTKELEEGPEGANISGTLPGLSHHGGNLFSFIGFNEGDNPTDIIKEALKQSIRILFRNSLFTKFSKGDAMEFGFRVNLISSQDLSELVPYPDGYSDGNLLEDLEKGKLKGLSHYIYDENLGSYSQSRSGTGLQAKTRGGKMITIREGDNSKPIPYIDKMLEDLAKRLRNNI